MGILINSVKIVKTGADGGRLYICGRGMLPDHAGEINIYGFFDSRTEEQRFEHAFSDQVLDVVPSSVSFTKGIGGEIRIASWSFS
jgi:hypothetical protein